MATSDFGALVFFRSFVRPPQFGVTMIKDAASAGFQGSASGVSETSFQNLRLDIAPVY